MGVLARSGSVTQDSIMVRVHQEECDSLPGLSASEGGELTAQFGGGTLTLAIAANSTRPR